MTAYNAEKYIFKSIRSLINQTFKDWQLIFVDDKSTDNTLSIVKSINNNKIKIYPLQKNIGRTKALNFGLKKCKTKYTAILDADDIAHKNRLLTQLKFLQNNKNYKMVGSWADFIDANEKKIGEIKFLHELNKNFIMLENLIPHSSVMYDTQLAKKLKGYPNDLRYAQDFGLILKFLKKNSVAVLPKFLCKIRLSKNNMSNAKKYRYIILRDEIKLAKYIINNFKLSIFQKIKLLQNILKVFVKFLIKIIF